MAAFGDKRISYNSRFRIGIWTWVATSFPLSLADVSMVLGANTQPLRVIPAGPTIEVTLGSLMTTGWSSCPFLKALG